MLRAIIIDDELASIKVIEMLAGRYSNLVKIVAASSKPEEALELIENYQPDVVFLDIHMPTMDGFEMLNRLSYRDFKLVFTTAHKDYAFQAIKHKPYDYLLKPINEDDFRKCISDIALENENIHDKPFQPVSLLIEVQVQDGVLYLKQKDIIRLEASGSYTQFYMDNGKHQLASRRLGEFEKRLDPKLFYRCHKSHIINLQKVEKFVSLQSSFHALMNDGSQPSISKDNKAELLQILKNLT